MKYSKLSYTLSGFQISIASPKQILIWASRLINNYFFLGLITNPNIINYSTGTPVKNGLFCEKIFGPLFSWRCVCNKIIKVKKINNIQTFCKSCGGELNSSIIRRYRLGCIILNTPIIHPWYYKSPFLFLPLLLNCSLDQFKYLIYFKFFLVTSKKNSTFSIFLTYFSLYNLSFINYYLQKFLLNLNFLEEINKIREFLLLEKNYSFKQTLYKKLNLLHLLYISQVNPTWFILDILPVIPAGIRPILQLNTSNFLTSPINDLYKFIIIRNNRLKKLSSFLNNKNLILIFNEKRILQQSIEQLIDSHNTTLNKTILPKVSLTTTLLNKYGRFRQNILGKRIDFSARSVITSGPNLLLTHLGVPFDLAFNLFKPIILSILEKSLSIYRLLKFSFVSLTTNILLKRLLIKLFKFNIILVNRAPTLHRMNIQAFKPYLVEGLSLKFYPLICHSFNADFDGDQMSIFLTLTKTARIEAKSLLAVDKNIFIPLQQKSIFKLTQTINLGIYILSLLTFKYLRGSFSFFTNLYDSLLYYYNGLLDLQNVIWIKFYTYNKFYLSKYFVISTIGRLLLNQIYFI